MNAPPEFTEDELRDLCRFHATVGPSGEGRPVLLVWAVPKGPVQPVPEHVYEQAALAFRSGGLVLIMTSSPADREAAKAALQWRLGRAAGHA